MQHLGEEMVVAWARAVVLEQISEQCLEKLVRTIQLKIGGGLANSGE